MSNHERFLDALRGSDAAEFVVARYLNAKGNAIEIKPKRFAPTVAEHEQFRDDGDLFAIVRHRIEVKHLSVAFTCEEDFPHPHLFIGRVDMHERANGSIAAVFVVSADLRYAAIVGNKTRPEWYRFTCFARNSLRPQENYCCPKHLARWQKLIP